jgi:hypothetical protein
MKSCIELLSFDILLLILDYYSLHVPPVINRYISLVVGDSALFWSRKCLVHPSQFSGIDFNPKRHCRQWDLINVWDVAHESEILQSLVQIKIHFLSGLTHSPHVLDKIPTNSFINLRTISFSLFPSNSTSSIARVLQLSSNLTELTLCSSEITVSSENNFRLIESLARLFRLQKLTLDVALDMNVEQVISLCMAFQNVQMLELKNHCCAELLIQLTKGQNSLKQLCVAQNCHLSKCFTCEELIELSLYIHPYSFNSILHLRDAYRLSPNLSRLRFNESSSDLIRSLDLIGQQWVQLQYLHCEFKSFADMQGNTLGCVLSRASKLVHLFVSELRQSPMVKARDNQKLLLQFQLVLTQCKKSIRMFDFDSVLNVNSYISIHRTLASMFPDISIRVVESLVFNLKIVIHH